MLAVLTAACGGPDKERYTYYEAEVTIDAESQSLETDMKISYLHTGEPTDRLEFLLNENFTITSLSCDNLESYEFDTTGASPYRFTPSAGLLTIQLNRPVRTGESVTIGLHYAGRVVIADPWGTNRISTDWIELGMYTPWFPYSTDIPELTYRISLAIGEDYIVAGKGKTVKSGDKWEITNTIPDNDMIITAARDFKTRETKRNGAALTVAYVPALADSTVNDILGSGMWILNDYENRFGPAETGRVSLVVAPRTTGGGYARKGFVVLSSFTDEGYAESRAGNFRFVAHEFSHLWWRNAPADSWEDWLNESFAEYSALSAVRARFGQEEFEKRLADKAREMDKLPSIRGLDRGSETAYRALYDKGCVLLFDLEKETGHEKFQTLLAGLVTEKVSSTDRFLQMLGDIAGAETAAWFNEKLNK